MNQDHTSGPARGRHNEVQPGSGQFGSGQPGVTVNGAAADAPTARWGAQQESGGEKVTERRREVVDSLPDWDPLPPGETLIRRRPR
ncbi:hypothetical protein [Nocardiopsis valliformis]|uniref:hypothetical protein n=1 Tax=Nocardiopsis valliformis TaxID=239974 RepID=UPI00034BAB75|nr:hypothetical protein [Nocardiopsis valliformis]